MKKKSTFFLVSQNFKEIILICNDNLFEWSGFDNSCNEMILSVSRFFTSSYLFFKKIHINFFIYGSFGAAIKITNQFDESPLYKFVIHAMKLRNIVCMF